jgi:threonine synthase
MHVTHLRCIFCAAAYAPGEVEYTCPACGATGILDVEYDYDAVRREFSKKTLASNGETSMWRYAPLLPVADADRRPRLRVGWTPVYETPRLARELGVKKVWIKDEGLSPTGSAKDRASAIATVRAASLGQRHIACASTGNAASSLAGLAADMDLMAHIFVPATAPEAKVAQLLVYGAQVLLVDAPYAGVWELCQQAVENYSWYNRNCAVNPYLVEGKKTGGLEAAEQLAGDLPDVVAVAVGDGCTVAGIGKGFDEMHRLGIVDRVPRLLGVQAEGAAPIAGAHAGQREEIVPVQAQTLADSISVGTPRNGVKALRAVEKTGGTYVTVADQLILEMIPRLARGSGVFGEPAAVAALAGVKEARAQQWIDAHESVLIMVTGNGLKDVRGVMRSVSMPEPIPATLTAVHRSLAS